MSVAELSPAELAIVTFYFEQAEPAPESCIERVARALWETVDDWPWEKTSAEGRAYARRQAQAAIAAMKGCVL